MQDVTQRRVRCSNQAFSAARSECSGIGCQNRCHASRTFFSTWPFSHPAAGLQNSGSNTYWFAIARNRRLICLSLPRPTRSTAARVRHRLGPMAARPHCHRCHVHAHRRRPGSHDNGHQTTFHEFAEDRPGPKTNGTKVPCPFVWLSHCRSVRQSRTKTPTLPLEPVEPSTTRSACSCFIIRRCLRDLPPSVFSHPASLSARGSSLLHRSGIVNCGSSVAAFKYFLMVLRDILVRRATSPIGSFSRKDIRLTIFNSPMWIALLPPPQVALGGGSHGSILNGNYTAIRTTSAWKSTLITG